MMIRAVEVGNADNSRWSISRREAGVGLERVKWVHDCTIESIEEVVIFARLRQCELVVRTLDWQDAR